VRVWVAGARGLLGQAVVGQLVAQGRDHVTTDRDVDLTDAAAVDAFAAAEPFTHVINCAAYTAVDRCESEEDVARQVNGDAPGHLARAARARGAALVHVSTDYVFAGDAHAPYREDDPTGPVSAYGRTKLLGEQRLFAAIGDGAGYVVRTSWLFGAGGPSFPATMPRLFGEPPGVRGEALGGEGTYNRYGAAGWYEDREPTGCLCHAEGHHHFADSSKIPESPGNHCRFHERGAESTRSREKHGRGCGQASEKVQYEAISEDG